MVISFIATWFKRLGAICLAFVVLWHLTAHGAPTRGKVMVHLASADGALVIVDGRSYRVGTVAQGPVVCDLEPGRHVVQVWRHGHLEGEEAFTLQAGQVANIGPLRLDRADEARPAGQAREAGPAGLTAYLRPTGGSPATN